MLFKNTVKLVPRALAPSRQIVLLSTAVPVPFKWRAAVAGTKYMTHVLPRAHRALSSLRVSVMSVD